MMMPSHHQNIRKILSLDSENSAYSIVGLAGVKYDFFQGLSNCHFCLVIEL